MKKLRSILSTLGAVALASSFSTAFGQEWVEKDKVTPLPQFQQVANDVPIPQYQKQQPSEPVLYAPAPGYAADVSFEQLVSDIEDLKKELAKKSDKPDPKKGFTAPKIGGRVFIDSVNILNQDADGTPAIGVTPYHGQNSLGFREARLAATGTAYDFLDYKLELGFDVTNAGVSYKDVFVGVKYVPLLGYVRVGHQYVEDAGSEICNGSTNYTFMEGPAPAESQFTSRRLGISSRHLFARDRGRLFLGAFGAKDVAQGNHRSTENNQGYILNARLTYAPMFQKEGKCMFLYGGYYSFTDPSDATSGIGDVRPGGFRDPGTGDPSYRFRPLVSSNLTPDNIHKLGFETIYQNGAFTLQTDFFLKQYTEGLAGDDATLYGGFVMGRLFLTRGDYRKYSLENGCWGAVNVACPFLLSQRGSCTFMQGPGAWELATYYGILDNSDFVSNVPTQRYGTDHEIGLALNWYWNPQLKWALNYVHQMADITSGVTDYSPNADIVGLSCRYHW